MTEKKKKKGGGIFTGLARGEKYEKGEAIRCYICKRYQGDESLFIHLDGKMSISKLKIDMYYKTDDKFESRYPLCVECANLLSSFQNMESYPIK